MHTTTFLPQSSNYTNKIMMFAGKWKHIHNKQTSQTSIQPVAPQISIIIINHSIYIRKSQTCTKNEFNKQTDKYNNTKTKVVPEDYTKVTLHTQNHVKLTLWFNPYSLQ